AHDLTPGAAAPEETEILSQRAIPFREALEMAVSGAIRDSLTDAGLLRAHHMAVTGAHDPALTKAMLG
ncbi:MAG: DNA mismatch repair protein MutT, partial [Hyphomonadaceae bacterium]